jgi:hypothetical protein
VKNLCDVSLRSVLLNLFFENIHGRPYQLQDENCIILQTLSLYCYIPCKQDKVLIIFVFVVSLTVTSRFFFEHRKISVLEINID